MVVYNINQNIRLHPKKSRPKISDFYNARTAPNRQAAKIQGDKDSFPRTLHLIVYYMKWNFQNVSYITGEAAEKGFRDIQRS